MSFAYLVVLVEFYYVFLVFDMYLGFIGGHGKGSKRNQEGTRWENYRNKS
jgi:hypothetical protein